MSLGLQILKNSVERNIKLDVRTQFKASDSIYGT